METLSLLSGVVFILAFVPYVVAVIGRDLRWKQIKPAEPKIVSWLIWGSLDFITFAGMWASHTVNGQISGACIGVGVVIAFVMKYGKPGWEKTDKYALGGAVFGIALWAYFDSPVLGILTSCAVAFIGSIPTFKSEIENPGRENKVAWTLFWISCVMAVIAIPHWTLADAAQPLMFFIIETIMMYILFVRRAPKLVPAK